MIGMKILNLIVFSLTTILYSTGIVAQSPLVLFSDFGTSERFVASMKGVAMSVDQRLQAFDLTHEIEPQNIWQASFVLNGTIEYWPPGTVIVSVVDPGVGTPRKSVVAKTAGGHFIVTPDNGTLTLIADTHEIVAMREIDESSNRRPGTEELHTFHGRGVYAYTGSRLAAGMIDFAGVVPELPPKPITLAYQRPAIKGNLIVGTLIHVEKPFGNLVTNIPSMLLSELGLRADQKQKVWIRISNQGRVVFEQRLPFVPSFGFVGVGEPLLYVDSLNTVGLAVANGDFSAVYSVVAGDNWSIEISAKKPSRK